MLHTVQYTATGEETPVEEAASVFIQVELSPAGVASGQRALDEINGLVSGRQGAAAPAAPIEPAAQTGPMPDVVTVYKHAQRNPQSRTPALLELFAREALLTPAEIGVALGNGQPLSKTQGRAIVRNLSRMQGHLLAQGRISNEILVKEFSGYEREGAGRYGFSDEDRAAIRAYLGI